MGRRVLDGTQGVRRDTRWLDGMQGGLDGPQRVRWDPAG